MKIFNTVLLLTFIVSFTACKKHNEPDINTGTAAFIVKDVKTLQDAELLFIEYVYGKNRLMKIRTNGTVDTVTFYDNTGKNVTENMHPVTMCVLNEDCVIISMSRNGSMLSEAYLLRKSDHVLIPVPNEAFPASPNLLHPMSGNLVRRNGDSYYYLCYGIHTFIGKLDLSNMASISGTRITPDSLQINDFEMDVNGNFIIDYFNSTTRKLELYISNNTLQTIPGIQQELYFSGLDGNFLFQNTHYDQLQKATFNPGTNLYSFGLEKTLPFNEFFARNASYIFKYNNKLIVINYSNVYELDNSSHTPSKSADMPFNFVRCGAHSPVSGKAYIGNDHNLYKIDLNSNYTCTPLSTDDIYTFYEVEALNDGTVYAAATHTSDQKYVILKYDPDGTETVLTDALMGEGCILENLTEFNP